MGELQDRLAASLAGRYTIERELGRGGMATVFEAADVRHGRRVAIKVLDPEIGIAVGADRFQREIQIAARLSHPHILPVHDSGEADGLLYYVMPLVEGESLRSRMTREQQLPVDDAIRITMEVADALAHAHAYGIVHRDIKPENVLLQSGHAVVADFGIARAVADSGGERLTQTGASVGTPLYMSPEQASADPNVDGRSDIYSLACVLYEMLIGQPPFTGPNAMAIIARHTMESVPSLQVVRQTIPDELEDTILTALEKVPADRFATASQFREALELALIAAPSSRSTATRTPRLSRAMHTTRAMRALRQRRRRQWIIAAAATLVFVLGGGALWYKSEAGARQTGMGGGMDPKRLAVMYLETERNDSAVSLLANGLTESLIERLSRVSALTVVSANGVAPFRGADVPRDSVARALSVGTLVSGSVEPERDRMRLTLRLFDASGAEFRRGSFAVPAADIAKMESELADSVELFLRARLGEEIRLRERAGATSSSEAWTLFQRGVAERRAGLATTDAAAGAARLGAADSLFRLAEAADEKWADPLIQRAHVALELADARTRQRRARGALFDSALAYAGRAVALAPNDPDALEARGTVRFQIQNSEVLTETESARMLAAAEEDLRKAISIEPRHAGAWATLSVLHYRQQDVVNAKLAAERAYEADAFLARPDQILYRLWATSYDLQQFEQARKWCEEGYRRFAEQPRFTMCKLVQLSVPGSEPDVGVAWALADSMVSRYPEGQRDLQQRLAHIWVGAAIGRAGLRDSAFRVLDRARPPAGKDPGMELHGLEAAVRSILGDRDEAIRLLRAYLTANPGHRKGFGRTNSWWWDELKGDPRYKEIAG